MTKINKIKYNPAMLEKAILNIEKGYGQAKDFKFDKNLEVIAHFSEFNFHNINLHTYYTAGMDINLIINNPNIRHQIINNFKQYCKEKNYSTEWDAEDIQNLENLISYRMSAILKAFLHEDYTVNKVLALGIEWGFEKKDIVVFQSDELDFAKVDSYVVVKGHPLAIHNISGSQNSHNMLGAKMSVLEARNKGIFDRVNHPVVSANGNVSADRIINSLDNDIISNVMSVPNFNTSKKQSAIAEFNKIMGNIQKENPNVIIDRYTI